MKLESYCLNTLRRLLAAFVTIQFGLVIVEIITVGVNDGRPLVEPTSFTDDLSRNLIENSERVRGSKISFYHFEGGVGAAMNPLIAALTRILG